MARPWPKRSKWPYVAKDGRRSYTVGFYDHDKRERSRSFPSVQHARAWMDAYITAERRGCESLRRFLLDLDAKEANETEARTLGQVLELYLAVNAHPRNEGGLAPSTYERYEWTIRRHLLGGHGRSIRGRQRPLAHALAVCATPAVRFNEPQAPRAWREEMLLAGVPKPTRDQAWSVLSAALSWAASSKLVPEIQTNGCSLASEPRVNRRRSARHGGTGYAPAKRRHGPGVASWALSPLAVEAIRAQMLQRVAGRRSILAYRDATIVSLQYGLGARNQEVWALRWSSLVDEFAWVLQVLSDGQLCDWGKTARSTQRRTYMPPLLREDLTAWRAALEGAGHRTRDCDFIIPGNVAGYQHGVRDPNTGACHLTDSQADAWRTRIFTPAVKKAAQRPEFSAILGATPYALRRGGISLRLRAEDPQTVASECGTSLKMLNDHYAFAIDDLRRHGPRPAEIEWRTARDTLTQHHAQPQELSMRAKVENARSRSRLSAWFASHRRRARGSHD